MKYKFIIHENKTFWGKVYHIITSDGYGHLQVSIENDTDDILYLTGLSVYKDFRKQGIGTMLLKKAEEIGKENNILYIKLNIEKNNLKLSENPLYNFYINNGYKYLTEDNEYIYFIKYI